MARRTKEDAEKTRQCILDAAEAVFLSKNVDQASLEDVARAAGVTRGAIYWHFENKASVFDAMVERAKLPPHILVERLECDVPPAPLGCVRDLCVEFLRDLVLDPRKRRVFTIVLLRMGLDCAQELPDSKSMTLFISLIRKRFQMAHDLRLLAPDITPDLAAQSTCAYLFGIMHRWLRDPLGFDLLASAEALMDIHFRGLQPGWHTLPQRVAS